MKNEIRDVGNAFIGILRSIVRLFIMIGRLFVAVFKYAADERIKQPRTSFGVELGVIVCTIFCAFIYVRVSTVTSRDNLSKTEYEYEKIWEDSVMKSNLEGYARGRNEVLDSIEASRLTRDIEYTPNPKRTIRKKAAVQIPATTTTTTEQPKPEKKEEAKPTEEEK